MEGSSPMTTSPVPSLREISEGTKIPSDTLAFFRERLRIKFHQMLLREFARWSRSTGLKQRDLAERTGRRPEVVSRTLGNPKNLRLDTISDILLGMGVEPTFGVRQVAPAARAAAGDDMTEARRPRLLASRGPLPQGPVDIGQARILFGGEVQQGRRPIGVASIQRDRSDAIEFPEAPAANAA